MAGTITTSTIQNDTSSPPTFRNNSVEIGTLCRAWVNFNGTGTVAIRASFNVSSITDNGTGDYTINFTTAMPDANYSLVGSSRNSTTRMTIFSPQHSGVADPLTTTSARVRTSDDAGTVNDSDIVSAAVFR
jgi:hypothetical protein